jgi:uncharacterized membrane protein YhiD involved in acid resistance
VEGVWHHEIMESFQDVFSGKSLLLAGEVLIKVGLGVVLGGAVGWERELAGRPAGIRTHILVCMGVVIFAESSRYFGGADSSRIAAQVVTGIGFLGAGTILRSGLSVKGLTTAASIWAVASIGMAVSVGGAFYWVAIVGTLLCLLTLVGLNRLEEHTKRSDLVVHSKGDSIRLLCERLQSAGLHVEGVRRRSHGETGEARLSVKGSRTRAMEIALSTEGVEEAYWLD